MEWKWNHTISWGTFLRKRHLNSPSERPCKKNLFVTHSNRIKYLQIPDFRRLFWHYFSDRWIVYFVFITRFNRLRLFYRLGPEQRNDPRETQSQILPSSNSQKYLFAVICTSWLEQALNLEGHTYVSPVSQVSHVSLVSLGSYVSPYLKGPMYHIYLWGPRYHLMNPCHTNTPRVPCITCIFPMSHIILRVPCIT